MNRGSRTGQNGVSKKPMASMRPRFMNRGSQGFDLRLEQELCRFNEAPIHESGKCDHDA